ncbi:MAG TPA: hypothetical protein VMU90_02855 [Solirubrobacteraceae bacterium]|nr:hypothetical protein [Solirubrobacteraceae bacterium]
MAGSPLSRLARLRQLPVARLLALAELVLLAREHYGKLKPHERRRILALVRRARGRPANLTRRERAELSALLAKTDPRLFMESAVRKVTGVPLPGRTRQPRRPGSS